MKGDGGLWADWVHYSFRRAGWRWEEDAPGFPSHWDPGAGAGCGAVLGELGYTTRVPSYGVTDCVEVGLPLAWGGTDFHAPSWALAVGPFVVRVGLVDRRGDRVTHAYANHFVRTLTRAAEVKLGVVATLGGVAAVHEYLGWRAT